jgi:hypothetical protein
MPPVAPAPRVVTPTSPQAPKKLEQAPMPREVRPPAPNSREALLQKLNELYTMGFRLSQAAAIKGANRDALTEKANEIDQQIQSLKIQIQFLERFGPSNNAPGRR